MHSRFWLSGSTAVVVCALAVSPAIAQDASAPTPAPTAAPATDAGGTAGTSGSGTGPALQAPTSTKGSIASDDKAGNLEEIIVRARRIDERLQDVPIAITALSGADLERKSVQRFADLQFQSPSLTFSQSLTRTSLRVTLRGQSTAYASDFPGVDTLFAEVPTNNGVDFYDLESVQVLKGPQGVAFGRNSTGGAILLYPTKPKNELGASASVTIGNYDDREYEGYVNVPIIGDKLIVRAAGRIDRRDGTTRNLTTGHKLDDRHLNAGRVTVLARPTDWLENTTIVAVQRIKTLGAANHLIYASPKSFISFIYPSFLTTAATAISLGRDKIQSNYDGFADTKNLFVSNTTVVDLSDSLTLKNIFGLQEDRSSTGTDMDGLPLSILELQRRHPKADRIQTLSNETQLQGTFGDIKTVVGFFYSHQKPVALGNGYEGLTADGEPIPPGSFESSVLGSSSITKSHSVVTSVAPFGQATVPLKFLANGLTLTAGARYTTDTRDVRSFRETNGHCSFVEPTGNICDVDLHGKFKGWNYAVTLDYEVDPATKAYVAHRHGFKGGAFNETAQDPSLLLVKPEYVDDVEVGLKSDLTIGSVQIRNNFAAYYQWYRDIVRTDFIILPSGTAFALNRNIGKATIKGLELETTIVPTRNLTLSAFYSLTEGRYTGASDPNYVFAGGKRFPDVPRNKFSVTGQYDLPLGDDIGKLDFSLTASYTSRHAIDQNALSPIAYQPGYTLVNGRIDLARVAGTGLDIGVFCKNLTDKKYYLAGGDFSDSLGFIQTLYGEPRTYGIEARYTF